MVVFLRVHYQTEHHRGTYLKVQLYVARHGLAEVHVLHPSAHGRHTYACSYAGLLLSRREDQATVGMGEEG